MRWRDWLLSRRFFYGFINFLKSQIHGLRLEAAEKLNKIKPLSIGQASRISGVSPADVSMLVVWLHSQKGENNASEL